MPKFKFSSLDFVKLWLLDLLNNLKDAGLFKKDIEAIIDCFDYETRNIQSRALAGEHPSFYKKFYLSGDGNPSSFDDIMFEIYIPYYECAIIGFAKPYMELTLEEVINEIDDHDLKYKLMFNMDLFL